MFGTLRFCLALMVAVSHMVLLKFNLGESAVIVFYLLSGYVMTHSFLHNFQAKYISRFYLDRLIRIYPIFLLFCGLALIFVLSTGYGDIRFSFAILSSIFSIIPINFYMFYNNPADVLLIPPAWSLGAEMQFYLLIPFLLYNRKLFYTSFFVSICIFIAAGFEIFNSDYYGYRLLPGVLFIFLCGSLLYQGKTRIVAYIYMLIISLMVVMSLTDKVSVHMAQVLTGIIFGIILVAVLAKHKIKSPIDNLLGNLSYPVYLNHVLVIWVFDYFNIRIGSKPMMVVLQLVISIFLAYLSYRWIDGPAQRIRKTMQNARKAEILPGTYPSLR